MTQQALIIMAKRPEAGRTKTRLCPPLTHQVAADLYECFLHDIVTLARETQRQRPNLQPFFAYSPLDSAQYFSTLAPDFGLIPQKGADLGERLDAVITGCFKLGYDHVAAINSDSPTLPPTYLVDGFDRLGNEDINKKVDAVFGPTEDGGYYFIGVKKPQPRLVCEVEMSTPRVLEDTLAIAHDDGLKTELLSTWYDVDTVGELERLHAELGDSPQAAPQTKAALDRIFST